MPRNKVVKSAARKKQPSKQASKTPANQLQKLENDFSATPAKLAEQLTKEIAALKQKENKLATTLKKIQTQASKIKKSIVAAKKLSTASGRKQLAAAKKALNDTKKDYALSNAALKETTAAVAQAEINLAKCYALAKLLKAFNKDWAKQARKLKAKAKTARQSKSAKPKAKAKAKTKATSRRKASGTKADAVPALSVVEQDNFDNFDHSADENTQLDDVKQAV